MKGDTKVSKLIYLLIIMFILYYIICWHHAIFRMRTGGKYKDGPGPYGCDPNVTFDNISLSGISFGTLIIICIIITLYIKMKYFN